MEQLAVGRCIVFAAAILSNFVHRLPTLAFHRINSDSAGNYELIDVESTVRMGFLPGITISGTRNPPEEGDSTGNYQLIYSSSGR
jgi:hypothetical protein